MDNEVQLYLETKLKKVLDMESALEARVDELARRIDGMGAGADIRVRAQNARSKARRDAIREGKKKGKGKGKGKGKKGKN